MRTCSRCKQVKLNDEFYVYAGAQCKECIRKRTRKNNVKLNPFPPPKTYEDYLREAGYDPSTVLKIW